MDCPWTPRWFLVAPAFCLARHVRCNSLRVWCPWKRGRREGGHGRALLGKPMISFPMISRSRFHFVVLLGVQAKPKKPSNIEEHPKQHRTRPKEASTGCTYSYELAFAVSFSTSCELQARTEQGGVRILTRRRRIMVIVTSVTSAPHGNSFREDSCASS